jgi:hypothetical protein
MVTPDEVASSWYPSAPPVTGGAAIESVIPFPSAVTGSGRPVERVRSVWRYRPTGAADPNATMCVRAESV